MRVSSYAVARPAFYDRNATSTLQNFGTQVAPHSDTTRWTTTVAAGKKLAVELVHIYQERITLATVVRQSNMQLIISNGVTNALTMYNNDLGTNTVGLRDYRLVTNVATIYAGESIYAVTSDASTGGLCLFVAVMKGTTYDA